MKRTVTELLGDGRDHNNKGYSIWMAGGGVRGGLAYGRLTYRYAGRDMRLTDVKGKVVKAIM